MPKRIFLVLLLVFSLLGYAACNNSDSEVRLRIFHASPDADALDVIVDGRTFLQAITYLFASDYDEVDSGRQDIRVVSSGTSFAVFDDEFDLSGADDFTLFIADFLSQGSGLLVSDERESPEEGESRLRAIHLAPSATEVDVFITPVSDDTALAELEPQVSGASFRDVSPYLNLSPRSYLVRVTLAGTGVIVLNRQITIEDREVYTAIVVDAVGGGTPYGLSLLRDTNN